MSATADGASVNMGQYTGVLTQMKRDRPWLISIHCANHRVELAVKSSFDIKEFKEVDEFYMANYNLLKQSGKMKAELVECTESLGIQFYKLSKIHGTRFISHRRRGLNALLETWPAYILTYENVESDTRGHNANTRSKVSGLLKKFKAYQFMCYVQVYLDLLEATVPMSMIFESEMLLPFEVPLAVKRTVLELQQCVDDIGGDSEFLDSALHRFNVTEDGNFNGEFVTAGDKRKHQENREYRTVRVAIDPFSFRDCLEKVWSLKRNVIPSLIEMLNSRFSDYSDDVFEKMRWFDPQYWTSEKEYGNEDVLAIATHFAEPLAFASFNATRAVREWKSFKNFVRSYYAKLPAALTLWKSVLSHRRDELPNLAKIASIIISISGSNSTVERSFSTLTNILSDKRLALTHKPLNESMIVYCNHTLWSKEEKDEVIERAVDIYLQSKRRKKITSPTTPMTDTYSAPQDISENESDSSECDSQFDLDDREVDSSDSE